MVCPSELNLYLCGVSDDIRATRPWLSIDRKIPSIVEVYKKRAFCMLDIGVPRYFPIFGSQACAFHFEHHQISLVEPVFIDGGRKPYY